MDAASLPGFVQQALDSWYPGRSSEAIEGTGAELGWVLQLDQTVALVRAVTGSNPFIWIRVGIAHAIPKSEQLAWDVAAGNKDLMTGRVYAGYGDELAMLVFDEAILAAPISFQHQATVDDLRTRLDTSATYGQRWAVDILQRFGGRRFGVEDWGLMSF